MDPVESLFIAEPLGQPLSISAECFASFWAQRYDVLTPNGAVPLSVGEDAPVGLDMGVPWTRLAILTAFDPLGRRLDDEANHARHRLLETQVKRSGHRFLPARVRDPNLNPNPHGAWPLEQGLAVVDPTDEQLDDWMLGFGQPVVVVADRQAGVELREHPHEEGRVSEAPMAAERSAARCWCTAWRDHDLAALGLFMHPEVVLKSTWTISFVIGDAAVLDWLHGWIRARAARVGEAPSGMYAVSGAVSIGATGRPCTVLSDGARGQASAVVLMSLDRGRVVQIQIEPPSRLSPIWAVPNVTG